MPKLFGTLKLNLILISHISITIYSWGRCSGIALCHQFKKENNDLSVVLTLHQKRRRIAHDIHVPLNMLDLLDEPD